MIVAGSVGVVVAGMGETDRALASGVRLDVGLKVGLFVGAIVWVMGRAVLLGVVETKGVAAAASLVVRRQWNGLVNIT